MKSFSTVLQVFAPSWLQTLSRKWVTRMCIRFKVELLPGRTPTMLLCKTLGRFRINWTIKIAKKNTMDESVHFGWLKQPYIFFYLLAKETLISRSASIRYPCSVFLATAENPSCSYSTKAMSGFPGTIRTSLNPANLIREHPKRIRTAERVLRGLLL